MRASVQALIEQLPAFRARVQAVNNRAVFEVPEILAALLARRELHHACAAGEGGAAVCH